MNFLFTCIRCVFDKVKNSQVIVGRNIGESINMNNAEEKVSNTYVVAAMVVCALGLGSLLIALAKYADIRIIFG